MLGGIVSTALIIGLTGCIPSGNIVGKATFYSVGDFNTSDTPQVTVDINGGVIATPKGLRARVTRASFILGGITYQAGKSNELLLGDPPAKLDFADSRIKGRNICGTVSGKTSSGADFTMLLVADPGSETQLLAIVVDVEGANPQYWLGSAPAGSLKVGGRNLCGGVG